MQKENIYIYILTQLISDCIFSSVPLLPNRVNLDCEENTYIKLWMSVDDRLWDFHTSCVFTRLHANRTSVACVISSQASSSVVCAVIIKKFIFTNNGERPKITHDNNPYNYTHNNLYSMLKYLSSTQVLIILLLWEYSK